MRVRLHAMPRELLHRQCTRDCQGSRVGSSTELPLGPMETLWIQLEGMIAQACGCALKNGSFCYEVTAYPNRKKNCRRFSTTACALFLPRAVSLTAGCPLQAGRALSVKQTCALPHTPVLVL